MVDFKQRQEIRHVDATPNEGYPLRILMAYLDEATIFSCDTGGGQNEFTRTLNELQAKRNQLLRDAIRKLSGGTP